MRIGIKATHIVEGGGLRHLTKVLDHFPRVAGYEYIVYLSESQRRFSFPSRNDVSYRYFQAPAHGLFRRLFWEQVTLRTILKQDAIDVLFEPGNVGMLGGRMPRVLLVHNIAPFSEEFISNEPLTSRIRLRLLRLVTRLSARSAAGIIHLTDFAHQYVRQSLHCDHVPQTTIHMGSGSDRTGLIPRSALERVFGISGMLIFCCSHIYRYKNVMETVRAYAKFREQTHVVSTMLIAGEHYDTAYTDEIRGYIDANGLQNSVKLIGSVDSITLHSLYAACDLFIFASWLESASLILIEALQMAAPIAAASTGLTREILEEAAAFFDPHDPDSICDTMKRVLRDGVLRDGLRRSARLRAKSFSWERTARRTLDFITQSAKGALNRAADEKSLKRLSQRKVEDSAEVRR